ncbi:MAG TPA: nitric oxide reductase [Gammaproteobacteria bacterium]|nr:nitric oxide reductase subunit B [bacterium BMS3Abin12]HDK02544.1 nitric oxide reductase [Gammaproteobacteria bacterium]
MADASIYPGIDEPDRMSSWLKWILFFVGVSTLGALIYGTVLTYRHAPPQPEQIVAPGGEVLFTGRDIVAGKGAFQQADLGDYGSIFGMGTYFGEDWTAKYLVRLGRLTADAIAIPRYGKPYAELGIGPKAVVKNEMQKDLHGLHLWDKRLVVSEPVSQAIRKLQVEISHFILTNDFKKGYTRAYSLDPKRAKQAADFILYSVFTTVARRQHVAASWTNNWPYEPLVGNVPTPGTFIWTWISFMITFALFGVVVFIFEHWINRDAGTPKVLLDKFNPLTPGQRAVAPYFLSVAAVFLLQIVAGVLMAHYYSDRTSFYGINIDYLVPFQFLRDFHLQGAIVWIGLAWLGSGLFLAPLIAGREGRGQGWMNATLYWVTLAVVAGALIGDYMGIMGWIKQGWFWVGNQGLAYLELGRLWQIGFFLGLLLWSLMMGRAIWPRLIDFKDAARRFLTGRIGIEHLLWASTLNIALLYWFGMIPLTGINHSFTITDFWRWWVVHLWVEQSFEFFFTMVMAYLLMATGLVSRTLATRTALFDVILIFLGGMLGIGHHMYWVGEPGMWISVGSVFSFIEVMPLLLLVVEASHQYRTIKTRGEAFPYRLAFLYIFGSAFWNFLGAGVFGGGTLNAPLVNYYEHGTFLTLNHAHTALFGAFGLMAIALIYFCLRYAAGDRYRWSDRIGIWAFWLYNGGMVLWIALNFFPIGWPQLLAVYEHGYAYARSLKFYDTTLLWQWLRFPGDVVFAAGAVLMALDFLRKIKPFFPRLFKPENMPALSGRR